MLAVKTIILCLIFISLTDTTAIRKTRQSEGECGSPEIAPTVETVGGTLAYRLLGGEEAREHSWPWMAYLSICEQLNNCKSCAGVLINADKVITAAHCVNYGKIKESKVKVWLGMHDLAHDEDGVSRNVSKIFSYSNLSNDFAILSLSKPVTMSNSISPICIPTTNLEKGTVCYITGWGKTSNEGSESRVLMQTQMKIVDSKECQEKVHNVIGDSQMCTYWSKNVSACDGDGGAPLQCEVNGYWQVHGLASYRVKKCGSDIPAVYSRVFYFDERLKEELYGSP